MRHTLTQPLPGTVVDPMYPDEDGRPMGDTDYHTIALVSLCQGLQDFFRDRDDVYVGMNLILYELGLRLVPEAEQLRLIDLETGEAVLTRLEKAELAEEEAARLAAEVERLRQIVSEQRTRNSR